jgi:hypothetical protein
MTEVRLPRGGVVRQGQDDRGASGNKSPDFTSGAK